MTAPLIAAAVTAMREGQAAHEREQHLRKFDPVERGFESFADLSSLVSVRQAAVEGAYYEGDRHDVSQSPLTSRYVAKLAATVVNTASSTGVRELPVSVLWRASERHYIHEAKRRMTHETGLLQGELNALYGTLGLKGKRQLRELVKGQEFSPAEQNLCPRISMWAGGAVLSDHFDYHIATSALEATETDLPDPEGFIEGLEHTRRKPVTAEAVVLNGLGALPGRLAHEGRLINDVRTAIACEFPNFGTTEPSQS